jgi:hypothetical protein
MFHTNLLMKLQALSNRSDVLGIFYDPAKGSDCVSHRILTQLA